MKDSAGPRLRVSTFWSAQRQRCACVWKLCHTGPRSRLKTYQRMCCPLSATMVGVLPTKDRPLRHIDSMLAPDDSVTVCGIDPECVQVTVPPGATETVAGLKPGVPASRMKTAAVAGPPATTLTRPLIGWNRH